MKLEWSSEALADLDRFAHFLHQHDPRLAAAIAGEILAKSQLVERHPDAGRPIGRSKHYRQIVLKILNGAYVFRYYHDGERLIMLRVFHGREQR